MPPRRSRKGLFGKLLLAGTALAAGGAFLAWQRVVAPSKVMTEVMRQTVMNVTPREVFDDTDALTVLVLGCDEDLMPGGYKNRKGHQIQRSGARSDTMLVAKFDFRRNTVTGLSIPRDTECRLSGYKPLKINAYHAIAHRGEENDLTQQAVEHLLPGVHIDRVVSLDYQAFQRMVDMVGGVKVDVNRRMKYTDRAGGLFIDLKPGKDQLLNGYDSMCFVRYRHGDSDFKRQERQKDFLIGMKDAVVARPDKLGEVADGAVEFLGNGFTPAELVALARFGKGLSPESIRMGMVPVVPGRGTNMRVDEKALPATLKEFGLS